MAVQREGSVGSAVVDFLDLLLSGHVPSQKARMIDEKDRDEQLKL
jgi:hypothetical protein